MICQENYKTNVDFCDWFGRENPIFPILQLNFTRLTGDGLKKARDGENKIGKFKITL